MKFIPILITLFFSICTLPTMAQSPQQFTYQAVVRDGFGNPLTLENINVRAAIRKGFIEGEILYMENHLAQTNSQGLFNLFIGDGNTLLGQFEEIDWGADIHFLQIEIDENGGNDFQLLGTQQLVSVPYALYAEKTGDVDDADADPSNEIQIISYDPINNILTLSNGGEVNLSDLEGGSGADFQTLSLDGTLLTIEDGNTVNLQSLQDGVTDADADPSNEIQYLSLQGDQLSISSSGSTSVTLPSGGDNSLWQQAGDDIYYEQGDVFVDRTLIVQDDILVQNIEDTDNNLSHEIISFSDGEGRLYTYGANGSTNIGLESTDNFNDGGLTIYDQEDTERMSLGISDGNSGYLETFGSNGTSNAIISSLSSNDNIGWLGLQDKDGYTQVYLTTVNSTGEGYVETVGPNGYQNIQLTSSSDNPNHGYISISEQDGYEAATMSVLPSGEGIVATVGYNGYDNVQLASLDGYPNNGYLAVLDDFGDIRAGTYIDEYGDGIVFGDVKNFRMDHPEQEGKEIWYASLEGPEAGAYTRGTGTLANGEAFIPFPEHFQAVANPETMTVQLTPLSADTRGLAVVEKTAEGFRVRELMNGTGNFGFDWEVKCVRKGYENYQVVRDASKAQPESRWKRQKERPGREAFQKRAKGKEGAKRKRQEARSREE